MKSEQFQGVFLKAIFICRIIKNETKYENVF